MNIEWGPTLALFLIITLGLILGKVRVWGISLDNAAVIFVGLAFGHFGIVIPEMFQTIGLVFFVFSIGMQSGPGFLATFGRNGLKMVLTTAGMILLSVAVMVGLAALFQIDLRLALGLFTGGRSSNSALAVGVESTASVLPSLGHSVAYPLAILSIVLYVRLLPIILRSDIKKEEKEYQDLLNQEHPPLSTRTFRVDNPNVVGRTLESLHVSRLTGVNISRIMQGGIIMVPAPGLILTQGDLVKAVGAELDLDNLALLLGPQIETESFGDIPLDLKHQAQWLFVGNKSFVNQSLNRLGILENHGATVTRIQRNGIEITPHGTTVLRYADRIMVVAGKEKLEALRVLVGDSKRTIDKDFLPLFMIISLGLFLGSLKVPLGPTFVFSFGLTGGVLICSLILSSLGRTGPILWAVSESSNRFIRQLGLVLFLGAVGTNAGTHIATVLSTQGLALILTALAISIVPLIVMSFFCRVVLKMNILSLMGLLSGATTCSPALGVVSSLTPSSIPSVAYATVFPFALIFMMVCAQVIAGFF